MTTDNRSTNPFSIPWNKIQEWSLKKQGKFQEKKLQQMLQLSRLAPYYDALYKGHNLRPQRIRDLDDFASFPFTTKADILPSKEQPEKARLFVLDPASQPQTLPLCTRFGLLLSKKQKDELVSEFKPVHVHFTSGRSAMSIPVFYTGHDLLFLQEAARRMMNFLAVPDTVRVINVFPYAPHLAFWQTVYATNYLGIFGLHTGGGPVMGTERIIENIGRMHAGCLVGMPSYIYHLLSHAVQHRKKLSSLKVILVGGEAVTSGFVEKLKHLLLFCDAPAVRVYSSYAFTEGKVTWSQCHEESGYHLYPDMELIEIVDNTGKRVPDGQCGEIVYTGLDFRGTIFLRYKTGDMGRFQTGACPYCGTKTPRLEPAITRSSEIVSLQLIKIKGSLVDLHAVTGLLSSLPFIDEWQLFIRKKKEFGLDDVVIHVASAHTSHTFVRNEIIRQMRATFHITPAVIFKPRNEIIHDLELEHRMKEKRIVDEREVVLKE